MKCYHHPSQDAMATCSECGKYICKDCYDTWKGKVEPRIGAHLCYECATEMIRDNIDQVLSSGQRIEKMRRNSLIGMIIGGILCAPYQVIGIWIGAGIGGIIGAFGLMHFFKRNEHGERGMDNFWGSVIAGPIMFTYFFIKDWKYNTLCKQVTESDRETLKLMDSYFKYSLAMEYAGNEANYHSFSSSEEDGDTGFGVLVTSVGYDQAKILLRERVAQIAVNEETIRAARGKK